MPREIHDILDDVLTGYKEAYLELKVAVNADESDKQVFLTRLETDDLGRCYPAAIVFGAELLVEQYCRDKPEGELPPLYNNISTNIARAANHSTPGAFAALIQIIYGIDEGEFEIAPHLFVNNKEQASTDEPWALFAEGLRCYHKISLESDEEGNSNERALSYFTRAARKDVEMADTCLAGMYAQGHGTPVYSSKAIEHAFLAAKECELPALKFFIELLREHKHQRLNEDDANTFIKIAKDHHMADFLGLLGDFFQHEQQFDHAVNAYLAATQLHDPLAHLELGKMFLSGQGVERKDVQQALNHLTLAKKFARETDNKALAAEACTYYALAFDGKNDKTVIANLRYAAEQKDPSAAYELGKILLARHETAKAERCFRLALSLGEHRAARELNRIVFSTRIAAPLKILAFSALLLASLSLLVIGLGAWYQIGSLTPWVMTHVIAPLSQFFNAANLQYFAGVFGLVAGGLAVFWGVTTALSTFIPEGWQRFTTALSDFMISLVLTITFLKPSMPAVSSAKADVRDFSNPYTNPVLEVVDDVRDAATKPLMQDKIFNALFANASADATDNNFPQEVFPHAKAGV